jgi:hypothetical protein
MAKGLSGVLSKSEALAYTAATSGTAELENQWKRKSTLDKLLLSSNCSI